MKIKYLDKINKSEAANLLKKQCSKRITRQYRHCFNKNPKPYLVINHHFYPKVISAKNYCKLHAKLTSNTYNIEIQSLSEKDLFYLRVKYSL